MSIYEHYVEVNSANIEKSRPPFFMHTREWDNISEKNNSYYGRRVECDYPECSYFIVSKKRYKVLNVSSKGGSGIHLVISYFNDKKLTNDALISLVKDYILKTNDQLALKAEKPAVEIDAIKLWGLLSKNLGKFSTHPEAQVVCEENIIRIYYCESKLVKKFLAEKNIKVKYIVNERQNYDVIVLKQYLITNDN